MEDWGNNFEDEDEDMLKFIRGFRLWVDGFCAFIILASLDLNSCCFGILSVSQSVS